MQKDADVTYFQSLSLKTPAETKEKQYEIVSHCYALRS
jgi:hypothetical protein